MPVVTLTGQLICADEVQARIVREHLSEHTRLSRAEPGCLSFAVEPTADPLVWQVDEAFRDAEAFAAHQVRGKASAWGQATTGIRRAFTITGA